MTNLKNREALINEVLESINAPFRVKYATAVKNHTVLEGFNLIKTEFKSNMMSPIVYQNSSWNRLTDYELAYELYNVYEENKSLTFDFSLLNASYIYDNVIPVVMSEENNKDMIKSHISKPFLDMVILYQFPVGNIGNIKITNELFENLKLDLDKLHQSALKNCITDCTFKTMYDVIMELDKDLLNEEPDFNDSLYVLTNKNKNYGAGLIISNEVLSKIHKAIKSDFFVLPSSIHECIILKDTGSEDKNMLKDMVSEVNNTEVALEEILTYSVYKYDGKSLKIVA